MTKLFESRSKTLSVAVFLFLTLTSLLCHHAFGQVVGATLSGTVTDKSGAAIAQATISAKNLAEGFVTSTTTNAWGLYRVPNLLAGTYEFTISASTFASQVRTGVTLTVGAEQVLNFELKAGGVMETVEVTGDVPDIDLNSSTISGVVEGNTIRELPLNGRSWTDLATLEPGVVMVTTKANINSSDRVKRGLGSDLSIAGGRPQQNNYLLDGISINDYSNAGPGSVLGGNLGVDAISEFSVLTTSYSTEYGRTSGGVVSAITRSGSNQLHGSAYEFLRNDVLDARNYFDTTIAPLHRNQFGASLGGPIRKDKTFFFVDYESIRQALGLSNIDFVPSAAARAGNLCAAPDCSTTTTVKVDPQAARFLKAFFPLPNGSLLCPFNSCVPGTGDTGIYSFSGSQYTAENFITGRIDHRFSPRDTISGSYLFDNTPSVQSDEFNNKNVISRTRNQLVALEATHIFGPALVNTARVGYHRDFAGSPETATVINPAIADLSYGFVPGDSAGQLSIPGLTFFSGGLSAISPLLYRWNSWQANDNVFFTKGLHALKFGVNIEREQDNTFSVPQPGGLFTYNSLSDFINNQPATSFDATVPSTITGRGLRQTIFGAYVQDDIHWRSNLTVNLGLRYEMATVPSEVNNKLSNLRSIFSTVAHLGSPYILNPTRRNFEPRIGFAWDPFRDGKTSVRAGFGLFDVLPLPVSMGAGVDSSAPYTLDVSGSSFTAGSFPTGAYQSIGTNPSDTVLRHFVLQFDPPRSYVMQWNLSIQREIARNLTAMVAYVASRGEHLWYQTDDANIVLPTLTSQGYTWPLPIGSGTRINPASGRTLMANWTSASFFNALEARVTKTIGSSFHIEGAYTWSKSIDTSSSAAESDEYKNSLAATFWPDPRTHRGLSDFNVGQHLVINYVWDVPTPASFAGPWTWPLRGWELGGIYTASSGSPFSVVLGGDPLGLNSVVPFDFPNRLTGPGCNSLVNSGNPTNYIKLQCFAFPNPVNVLGNAGRNILIGPGLSNFDFSLFKNNPIKRISESFNIQFRAEIFNILNHANFQSPYDNNTLFDGSGNRVAGAGTLDATSTTSRQIQLALKLSW